MFLNGIIFVNVLVKILFMRAREHRKEKETNDNKINVQRQDVQQSREKNK
jgi:hypothetical protein